MDGYKSLTHSRYDGKYPVVLVPKGRKRTLFGKIRKYLKGVFHELARQKGCEILSGHMATDHVHVCIAIPPQYAVSEVIG
jgi:putative transposase